MEELKEAGIRDELLQGLASQLEIKELTLIQRRCIGTALEGKDLIAQAPTGSGKTLAYLLPTMERLLRTKKEWAKCEIGAVVLVPTRELAFQVGKVAAEVASKTDLRAFVGTGGRAAAKVWDAFEKEGGNLFVATPGRLQELLRDFSLRGHLKGLEVLILDETDRLLELNLKEKVSAVLHALPKQRRTGLFSATQVEEDGEELRMVGLRNPLRVSVQAEEQCSAAPSKLRNFYLRVEAEWKIGVLAKLWTERWSESKVLIFLPTCDCVEYLEMVLKALLPKKTQILGIHRKKRKRREKIFASFAAMKKGLLLCTDVMGRGIDVSGIDWVVQLGPPKQTQWFVHRAGRTARAGAAGDALILIAPSEEDFIDYLYRQTGLVLQPLELQTELSSDGARESSEALRALALSDRAVLEKGTRAFVSFVQAYAKQDSRLVCPLRTLDVVGLCHAFGLLRMPKMPELAGRDLSAFRRCEVNTATIPFKDKLREAKRKKMLAEREKENEKRRQRMAQIQAQKESGKAKAKKTKRPSSTDVKDIDDDYRLLKKLKKGRLSQKEFNDAFQ